MNGLIRQVGEAIRTIRQRGLRRTSMAGPVGLIVGVGSCEVQRLREGQVLEFASEGSDFQEKELVTGPCLVFEAEVFEDLVDDFGPDSVFEDYLKTSHFGSYDKARDEVTLVSTQSVWTLVLHHIPPMNEIRAGHERGMWETDHWKLEGVRDFCRTHAACEFSVGDMYCGEKMCRAEHA